MTYTRETMQKMRREELKNIAISYRIYNGYHERPISKMRKSDFIDFIHESVNNTKSLSLIPRETYFYKTLTVKIDEEDGKIDITKMLLYIFYPSPLSSRDTLRRF